MATETLRVGVAVGDPRRITLDYSRNRPPDTPAVCGDKAEDGPKTKVRKKK
jgi:hypothetical protein